LPFLAEFLPFETDAAHNLNKDQLLQFLLGGCRRMPVCERYSTVPCIPLQGISISTFPGGSFRQPTPGSVKGGYRLILSIISGSSNRVPEESQGALTPSTIITSEVVGMIRFKHNPAVLNI